VAVRAEVLALLAEQSEADVIGVENRRKLQTLIKDAIKLKKGSAEPHRDKVASISRAQLQQIAETKMNDLNANDIDAAITMIAGTARSMGVTVEG
jgi:ribosomal protein L11